MRAGTEGIRTQTGGPLCPCRVPTDMPLMILIDGLNVAYWCGDPPRLGLPVSLLLALLEQGHPAHLYFDASARYRFAGDQPAYDRLIRYRHHVTEVASGRRADGVMLQKARASGGIIISRDRFRDYRSRFRRLIDDPARLLGGSVTQDLLHVQHLDLRTPVTPVAPGDWDRLLG